MSHSLIEHNLYFIENWSFLNFRTQSYLTFYLCVPHTHVLQKCKALFRDFSGSKSFVERYLEEKFPGLSSIHILWVLSEILGFVIAFMKGGNIGLFFFFKQQ